MIVLFLSGMVAMIMMRTLNRDLKRYNEAVEQSEESQQEETGWKLIHTEVFRPPGHGGMFSVLVAPASRCSLCACSRSSSLSWASCRLPTEVVS